MIVFENLPSTNTPLSAENLNQNFAELVPTELYVNDSGSTANITLSESSGNFTYLEVFYGADGTYQSTGRIYSPNGKTISLGMQSMGTVDARIYVFTSNWNISGNSMTFVKAANKYLSESNTVGQYNTNSYVRIYRVIGYK